MPAKNTPPPRGMITVEAAAAKVREMFGDRVVDTWLEEFGYTKPPEGMQCLEWALAERGPVLRREMEIHAKRLVDRQTMGGGRIVGRASVIR